MLVEELLSCFGNLMVRDHHLRINLAQINRADQEAFFSQFLRFLILVILLIQDSFGNLTLHFEVLDDAFFVKSSTTPYGNRFLHQVP